MRIQSITLYTKELERQKAFYHEVLDLPLQKNTTSSFSVQVGNTALTFSKSEKNYFYHYCFLIPSNKLQEAKQWLQSRWKLIPIEKERFTQVFESWNAESFYFYDGAGNLVEFIVRYDLKNEEQERFEPSQILNLNEIGLPTQDIPHIQTQLETELQSPFWKGDLERFGTNGTQEGLFLLVNHQVKKTWFPTQAPIQVSPFSAKVSVNDAVFYVNFDDEKLNIHPQIFTHV